MVFPGAKVGACLFSCLPGIGLQKQTQAADGASRAASAEPVALSILGLAGSRGCRRAACSSAALLVRAAVDVRRIFFSTLGHAPMSTTLCRHPRSYHLYPLPLPIELQSSPPELPPETRRALASIGPWSDHVVLCPRLSTGPHSERNRPPPPAPADCPLAGWQLVVTRRIARLQSRPSPPGSFQSSGAERPLRPFDVLHPAAMAGRECHPTPAALQPPVLPPSSPALAALLC